jgi:hypothetical protein
MRLLVLLSLLLLISCSEKSTTEEVRSFALRSDVVWLCDVDTNGTSLRFRAKQLLKQKGAASQSTPGQFLPVRGPGIESGTRYGDEALVFFSHGPLDSSVSADFILAFHDGKATDGTSSETLIKMIREEQTK